MKKPHLVECPRDAMQGWKTYIPASLKAEYINALLGVGFDTVDFGSFVSAKAIPQMADTAEVLKLLDLKDSRSSLLAIVANVRGAEEASAWPQISYMGFPFSVSPTFQIRNTNSTPAESLKRVEEIQEICVRSGRKLVIYLSMGFGNPYGDEYNEEILQYWAGEIAQRGIGIISLADTVGVATAGQIRFALETLIPAYPGIEFGVHLHTTPFNRREKLQAAVDAGCMRFDGALKGIGGCPMAQDELVGNMDTEFMINYFEEREMPWINRDALQQSMELASRIFS